MFLRKEARVSVRDLNYGSSVLMANYRGLDFLYRLQESGITYLEFPLRPGYLSEILFMMMLAVLQFPINGFLSDV